MNFIGQLRQARKGLSLSSGFVLQRETKSILLAKEIANYRLSHVMANNRLLRLVAVGGTAALASGTIFGYLNYQRYQSLKVSPAVYLKEDKMQLTAMPQIKPTQTVEGPTKLNFDLTLFQYCSCPFCCKTRTFLDYFGVNYNIVEVNPVLRQQLKWSTNYRKVPILLAHSATHGDHSPNSESEKSSEQKVYQINDSSVIVSSLGSYLMSRRTQTSGKVSQTERGIDDLGKILIHYQSMEVEDDDGKKRFEIPNRYFLMLGDIEEMELKKRESNLAEERHWRDWTDRVLVHSLSPNIYRSIPESLQAFNNFSAMGNWDKHFSTFERMTAVYAGSFAMWLIGKRLKKKYGLKDDVRESLYDNCRQWTKAIGKDRQFMGGAQPNLADLSVFGVLSSIEGCTAFTDVLENTNIKNWYFAVKECCQSHAGKQLVQSI